VVHRKKHQRGFVLTGAFCFLHWGKLVLNWRLPVIFAPMEYKVPILAVGVGERVQRIDAAFDVRDLHVLVARACQVVQLLNPFPSGFFVVLLKTDNRIAIRFVAVLAQLHAVVD
jgi:hypothetical protein